MRTNDCALPLKKRKELTWEEFMTLSNEEQWEYHKAAPVNEVKEQEEYDYRQYAITVNGDIDEYMKSLGGIMWEDFQKKIGEKYDI